MCTRCRFQLTRRTHYGIRLPLFATFWVDNFSSQNQLADIGFTAARRRSHYDYRLAVSGQTAADLVQKLDTWLEKSPDVAPATINPKVVFVCSGQGPQWWAMGRQLLETEPVFRQAIEQIDQLLRPLAKWSLIEEL